jgi:heme A synthase
VLTLCLALPLVTLGAEVTTKKVGMVDPQGFRAPWHLLRVQLQEAGLGYLIEHGHRLAGFLVGTCCIVLAVGLTFAARGALYRSLGWIALLAVSLQGVLGIFRVNLHALFGPYLALIHGCFAQVALATLVAVVVLTSRAWATPRLGGEQAGLRHLALALALLLYAQVVFGALVRHLLSPAAQRAHVLLALVVVAVAVWLIRGLSDSGAGRAVRRLALVLGALLVVQPVLGVEAWIRRFGSGTLPELLPSSPVLDLVRSGHQVVGTLLFAVAVALALFLYRPAVRAAVLPAPAATELEGAA